MNSAMVADQSWGIEMKEDRSHRMVFGDFVDKIFWLIISGFLFWIGLSVSDLNKNMAVAISQISTQKTTLEQHDQSLKSLIADVAALKAKEKR